jgi:NAD-dependent dihydropyrimidine dehydrogenase PreA subunit
MPHFINDSCINCAACESVCPVTCISEGDGARVIDESSCIDCAACVSVCPVDAIHAR